MNIEFNLEELTNLLTNRLFELTDRQPNFGIDAPDERRKSKIIVAEIEELLELIKDKVKEE